jgi:AcrR family transcriptional regulator
MAELNLRETKKAQTKEAIYRAAIALFTTRGFSGTTIGMIARKARIAPRTLFSYYPSKKEILFSVPLQHCNALIASLQADDKPQPTYQTYKDFLYSTLDYKPPTYCIELDEHLYPIIFNSPELTEYIEGMKDRVSDALAYSYAKDMRCTIDDFPARFAGDLIAYSTWTAAPIIFPYRNFTRENLDQYLELLEQTLAKVASQIRKTH